MAKLQPFRWLNRRHADLADVYCVALIVAVVTLAFLPVLASLSKFPRPPEGGDWSKECALNRSARQAVLRDHQLPLRSQYLGGGYPLVAYPEDSSLSPLFALTLVFGENAGLKLKVYVKLLVGALGMYYLLRAGLCFSRGGAVLGSLFLGLSEWFHAKTGTGYIGHSNYCFLPLMMALVLDAAHGRRSVILPSALFAVMLVDGKFALPLSLMFLAMWCVFEVVRFRRGVVLLRLAPLKTLALVAVVGCLLAMVKILPMIELLSANPRTVPYDDLGRWRAAYAIVFYRPHEAWTAVVTSDGPTQGEIGLGWVAMGLAIVGAVLRPRVAGRWAVLAALFAWLSMGYWAPADLWRLLWHLPVLGSINKPAFWLNFLILFPLCVLAASVFRGPRRSKLEQRTYVAYLCVGALGVGLLLHNAYQANVGSFTHPLHIERRSGPFYQVWGNGKAHTYSNMVCNVGSIDWDGDILLPERAVPRFTVHENQAWQPNPEYRGEVWVLQGKGTVRLQRFTANAIDLSVEATQPVTVVVNQNFRRAWRSSVGTVLSHEGLLAVADLPAGPRHIVRLRYVPGSFFLGLGVTAVSLLAVGFVAVGRVRAHGLRRCLAGTDAPGREPSHGIRIAFGTWSPRKRLFVAAGIGCGAALLFLLAFPSLHADYVLREAELLRLNGETQRAAELCERLLHRDPNSVAAREILAAAHYDEDRYRECVREFRRADSLGDMRPQSYARWARAHQRLGELAEAEQAYREALVAYPAHREARAELTWFLERMAAAARRDSATAPRP